MTDETTNLVLEHLREMRAILDQHTKDFADIKLRLTRIEMRLELADK